MFARDSQMLHNKGHFVTRVIAINMFYCIYTGYTLKTFPTMHFNYF